MFHRNVLSVETGLYFGALLSGSLVVNHRLHLVVLRVGTNVLLVTS